MIDVLKKTALFRDITEGDISAMLNCLGSHKKRYQKGNFIFLAGESKPEIGILLSGRVQIIKENIMGDSTIIGTLKAGDLFGETFASMGREVIPVSVIALEDCEVLFLDIRRIAKTCSSSCAFHHQIISNLLKITAEKNALLNQKMLYMTHKTIRSRLEAYFYDRIEEANSSEFVIPFNRNELADFLCIDRSAMCRELSKMKKQGVLDYRKNSFTWLGAY